MNLFGNLFAANDAIGTIIVLIIAGVVWFFNWLNDQRAAAPPQQQPRPPGSRIDWETLRGAPDRQQQVGNAPPLQAKPNRRERKEQRKKQQQGGRKEEPAPQAKAAPRQSSIRDDLKNRTFESRTQNFAERVEADTSTKDVDTRVDEHVHEAFDHNVGTLASQDAYTAAPGAAPTAAGAAAAPFDWLTKPESLRQAIIMQEILNRRF